MIHVDRAYRTFTSNFVFNISLFYLYSILSHSVVSQRWRSVDHARKLGEILGEPCQICFSRLTDEPDCPELTFYMQRLAVFQIGMLCGEVHVCEEAL